MVYLQARISKLVSRGKYFLMETNADFHKCQRC